MKQIVCEMCGGTDLVKDGGVFVCQSCGCKYSVEEVKKMMVEGTVEVQGTVQVSNTAKAESLLKMAQNAFDSKNYSKAEEFCDQIIAMDDKNYKAWKLKGEAINYQITAKNPRILEVYNCIMAAYHAHKEEYGEIKEDPSTFGPSVEEAEEDAMRAMSWKMIQLEYVNSLRTCMEGEVDFWLEQFEAGRPTKAAFAKSKNTYIDCYNKMKAAYEEMGAGFDAETYLKNFDNHFINKANQVCVSAWKSTVGYNYFRDDFSNLGANWNRDKSKKEYFNDTSEVYRPTEQIFKTFLDETAALVNLLEYCIEQFNDLTAPNTKKMFIRICPISLKPELISIAISLWYILRPTAMEQ